MKIVDKIIQRWRLGKALGCLPSGKLRCIDIGAHKGELFEALGNRLQYGFGIEPLAGTKVSRRSYDIFPGYFPVILPDKNGTWDVITMLAVLEHVPVMQQIEIAKACYELLKEGGRLIITVPSSRVDTILAVLKRLYLIDGMSLEEHYGFNPADVEPVFANAGFSLVKHKKFQFGLNNIYVFEKIIL